MAGRSGSVTVQSGSKSVTVTVSPSGQKCIITSAYQSSVFSHVWFFHQKNTKYKSLSAKIKSYNKTVDVSNLNPNDSAIIYNNGTHNYTTVTDLIYPGSDTIPDGQKIASEGGMNVLGLVVFSIVFGIVLGRMGDRGTPLKALFETLNEVVMKMVTLVMWYVTDKFHEIQFLTSSIKVIVFRENYQLHCKNANACI